MKLEGTLVRSSEEVMLKLELTLHSQKKCMRSQLSEWPKRQHSSLVSHACFRQEYRAC